VQASKAAAVKQPTKPKAKARKTNPIHPKIPPSLSTLSLSNILHLIS